MGRDPHMDDCTDDVGEGAEMDMPGLLLNRAAQNFRIVAQGG